MNEKTKLGNPKKYAQSIVTSLANNPNQLKEISRANDRRALHYFF